MPLTVLLRRCAIPWPILWLTLVGYLIVPAVFFAFYFFDLWAKAYDEPSVRPPAILFLALLCAVFSWFLAKIVRTACSADDPLARLLAVPLALFPMLLFVFRALEFVDWLPVYLSAFVFPLVLWRSRHRSIGMLEPAISVVFVSLILGITIRAQLPAYRLQRYTAQLQEGCWCCDYKTRALHELCLLGPAGRSAINTYQQSHPEESQNVRFHLLGVSAIH